MKKIVLCIFMVNCFAKSDIIDIDKLEKECENNNSHSCFGLGLQYDNGKNVELNYKLAYDYYKKACALNNSSACNNLGVMYSNGDKGIKVNPNKAFSLFKKSCVLGGDISCDNLGSCYENGIVTKKNLSEAKESYGLACDRGVQRGCDNYKRLNIRGIR